MRKIAKILKVPVDFPMCMRFSMLAERELFYRNDFEIEKMGEWMQIHPSPVFAAILGRYTRIFPREYARIVNNTIAISDYRDFEDVRDYIIQYRPESAYYDRNLYRDGKICSECEKGEKECWGCEGFLGQELAFDMDVENMYCPLHGDLDQRMNKNDPLSFCEYELSVLREKALDLLDELKGSYRRMRIVYSGRGYHIHILDRGAYSMERKERRELADQVGKRYPIDEWVTEGESHLIRLPFSLNGLVSRIALPLAEKELERFDPVTDRRCIPGFIKTFK